MLGLLLFIFLVSSTAVLVLYFNKSESAKNIKNVLKKILENLKDLFKSLGELLDLIKQLIPLENDDKSNSSSITEGFSTQQEEIIENEKQSVSSDFQQQDDQPQQEEIIEDEKQSVSSDFQQQDDQIFTEDKKTL